MGKTNLGKTNYKEMLLRHWQTVARGLDTVDHVLRRRDLPGSTGTLDAVSYTHLTLPTTPYV